MKHMESFANGRTEEGKHIISREGIPGYEYNIFALSINYFLPIFLLAGLSQWWTMCLVIVAFFFVIGQHKSKEDAFLKAVKHLDDFTTIEGIEGKLTVEEYV